ncbi:MAG TPA: TfoX/Sxy family protein [Hyphomicrobiaceae bacterium]|nr:TfoX/Sxy family protein [Hyphomicrobiaceae bacterium]
MAASRQFIAFVTDQMAPLGSIVSRRMFSGAGLYCDGVIFALILGDALYLRVDDGNRGAYVAEGLSPFSYQSRGRTVEIGAYWRVPERLFDDGDEMVDWAHAALAAGRRAAARKRPAPARRRRAPVQGRKR